MTGKLDHLRLQTLRGDVDIQHCGNILLPCFVQRFLCTFMPAEIHENSICFGQIFQREPVRIGYELRITVVDDQSLSLLIHQNRRNPGTNPF